MQIRHEIATYADEIAGGTSWYIRGVGLLWSEAWGETHIYVYNAHGDVVGLMGEDGKDYSYDAFGNQLDEAGIPLLWGIYREATAADRNPFRYCGEYFDEESGLIYLRARYYDSRTGGFISEDPIRDGLNWYAYCGGNPVMWVDPSGLEYVMIDYIISKYNSKYGENSMSYTIDYSRVGAGAVYMNLTVNGTTNRYGYIGAGGQPLINASYLINDFGLSISDATHQEYDIFDSSDDAALAWGLKYWYESNEAKKEFASAIFRNGDGYSFGEVDIGSEYSSFIHNAPEGYTLYAGVHTHVLHDGFIGFWDNLKDGNYFSIYDASMRGYYGDAAWALRDNPSGNSTRLYLIAPNGKSKLLDPYGMNAYDKMRGLPYNISTRASFSTQLYIDRLR